MEDDFIFVRVESLRDESICGGVISFKPLVFKRNKKKNKICYHFMIKFILFFFFTVLVVGDDRLFSLSEPAMGEPLAVDNGT